MAIEIVDFPIKHGDFPVRYVKLPEGIMVRTSDFGDFGDFQLVAGGDKITILKNDGVKVTGVGMTSHYGK